MNSDVLSDEHYKFLKKSIDDIFNLYTSVSADNVKLVKALKKALFDDQWIEIKTLPPLKKKVLFRVNRDIYIGSFDGEEFFVTNGFNIKPTHWAYLPRIVEEYDK